MGTYSDLLFGPSDAQLEPVQAPVERPAPIARPGGGAALPSAGASKIPQWGPNEVPQSFFLPNEEIDKLSPQDRDAYLKQRSEWFDYRQGTGRFAPKPEQAPRPSAAPAVPPQSAPVSPQAAPVPQAAPRQSYSDQLFGADSSAPIVKAPPTAQDPNAEPDAPTWMGRRWQDIRGKQDKRYSDLPTIAEALINEKNTGATANMAMREWGSWLTAASDKDMSGVYKGILGNRFVRDETDANGYPVVVYKDKDGKEAKAYVNKPGLDMQDAMRGVGAVAPFVRAGKVVGSAMAGAPLLSRMAGHFVAQGATSVAQDAAGVAAGVSDLDLNQSATKAGLAAAGGAAGEAVAAPVAYIWRKLVTEPRYYNSATGKLTEEGIKAAEAAGIDASALTSQMSRQFGREMARTGDAAAATSQATANEFGVRRTVGELTRDQPTLLREQQIYAGNYGERGAKMMKDFRELQKGDIRQAVQGMAEEMAPGRTGQFLGKAEMGANIRANTDDAFGAAKEFEGKAWKEVPEFKASQEALRHLDEVSLPQGLRQRKVSVIEKELTPAAAEMSDMIERFVSGEMPVTASKYVDRSLAGQVDTMRRRLLAASQKAANDTDERAAKAIYDSYNDWVVDAARMSGDPLIAQKMVTARTLSREIHEAFDGAKGTPGEKILGSVLKKAGSAEEVVDALFSGQTKANIKSGSIDALGRLKQAYTKYLEPEAAKAAWDDIKLAYFARAVMKNGAIMEPKELSSSLKSMLANQRTVLTTLGITREEMARVGRFASLLDDVALKNPNTSWSGVTMSQFLKEAVGALWTMIGGNSIAAKVAVGPALKPFQEIHGRELVRGATGGGRGARIPRLPPPPFAGPAGGLASSDSR